jgi:hypothetical protein
MVPDMHCWHNLPESYKPRQAGHICRRRPQCGH